MIIGSNRSSRGNLCGKPDFFLLPQRFFFHRGGVRSSQICTIGCGKKFFAKISTGKISTFHRRCGKIRDMRYEIRDDPKTTGYLVSRISYLLISKGGHSEELMFAVMSRMLFCTVVSPFFRAISTLRML